MARRHINVLLIEDNPGDVRLIWEILSEVRSSPFYLNVADSLKKGLEAIDADKPDVILLDLSLPDSNGIYTLNRVRDKVPEMPIVVITGMDDEMTAIKSLKEGAQDYLVKGRTDSDLLKKALLYAIERNTLISELSVNQEKLKDKEIVRANFINMVFHELLIPATVIKSTVNMCESGRVDHSWLSGTVKNNLNRIFGLLDDLINASEIEKGKFNVEKKEVQAIDIVKKSLKDLSAFLEENKAEVKTEEPGSVLVLNADARRMSQAVINLVLNSVKFSEKEPVITAGVKPAENGFRFPQYAGDVSGGVVFYVKDEGVGMREKELSLAINDFFSKRDLIIPLHERIGLGLVVAKSIAVAHGGFMWAESPGENKGCTFYIYLPAG